MSSDTLNKREYIAGRLLGSLIQPGTTAKQADQIIQQTLQIADQFIQQEEATAPPRDTYERGPLRSLD